MKVILSLILILVIMLLVWSCHHAINPYAANRIKNDNRANRIIWWNNLKFEAQKIYFKLNPTAKRKHNEELEVTLSKGGREFRENFIRDYGKIASLRMNPDTILSNPEQNIFNQLSKRYSFLKAGIRPAKYYTYNLQCKVNTDDIMNYYLHNIAKWENENPEFLKWKNLRRALDTGRDSSFLDAHTRELIILHNMVRQYPILFRDTYFRVYAQRYSKNWKSNYYYQSLYNTLSDLRPSSLLVPDKDLCLAAVYHSIDMGVNDTIGHWDSDNRTSAFQRVCHFTGYNTFSGENASYSWNLDPLHHFMMLLIDEGISSLGHRRNILNPDSKKIGIGLAPHKTYIYNITFDYMSSK